MTDKGEWNSSNSKTVGLDKMLGKDYLLKE